ncbi:RING-type E3 ubiquitin transferase [Trifolium repens]|nr:RING-type E3 ubiquitin transferase [Trifolium repens]
MESKTENLVTSAAAFVEGGIQESCDDACSICLEEFCDNDPSTVTVCRHEFHLQCVLDWCQRSSQCPMCWQPLSLTDPTGQELFKAVEQERNFWVTPSRNVNTFHQSTLRDFGLQHPRIGVNDYDLEERILQHLAVVASNERIHQLGQREGQRIQPIQQTPQLQTESSSTYGSTIMETNGQETYSRDRSDAADSCPINQNRAKPSELHSFSDTLRSRLNAVSTRYKESISKSTRCWKNKLLFPRSSSMAEVETNARKEMNPGIS